MTNLTKDGFRQSAPERRGESAESEARMVCKHGVEIWMRGETRQDGDSFVHTLTHHGCVDCYKETLALSLSAAMGLVNRIES